MKKHSSLSAGFTVACVVLMLVLFLVQARVHFTSQPRLSFNVTQQIAYGYGTDGCDMILVAQSFEDGLAPFDDSDWINVSNTALYGTHSVKASTISNNQSSELNFGYSTMDSGIISFGRRVSSQSDSDYLSFYVDDVLRGQWSGEVAWSEVSFAITIGFHDYKWVYSKDASGSSGSDTAWIDMVRIGQGTSCPALSASSSSPAPASSSSAAPVCGNGVKTSLEDCDDGDTTSGDGCSATCTIESGYDCTGTTPSVCSTTCGDGIKAGSEGCDDGDVSSGDGCSNLCAIESGYSCTGTTPSVCETGCGDSIVAGSEECDTGGASLTCDNDCTEVSCGDNTTNLAAGEECDTGSNNASNKTCTTSCLKTFCGDGVVQTPNGNGQNEACEPTLDSTCTNSCVKANGVGVTYTPPPPASSSAGARLAPPPNCGNGILEIAKGEECDQGRFNGLSPLCDRWCKSQFCGDNVVQKQNGEECEPARADDGTFLPPAQCGGRICTVPVCDTNGYCGGGCNWIFLPACMTSSASSAVSVFSASSAASVGSSASSSRPDVQNAIAQGIENTTGPLTGVLSSSSSISLQSLIVPVATSSSSSADTLSSIPSQQSPVCGDGIRNGDEECDRGLSDNLLSNGCTPTCKVSICGNSYLEPGEECDDGKRNSRSRPDSCSVLCLLPRCGDGIVDPAFGEVCDNGQNNSGTLPDSCRMNCIPAFCGDSVTDTGEQCDEGPNGSKSCTPGCILTSAAVTFNGVAHEAAPDNAAPNLLFLLLLLILFVHRLDRSLHRR